mgnify:CR=1 FL=1
MKKLGLSVLTLIALGCGKPETQTTSFPPTPQAENVDGVPTVHETTETDEWLFSALHPDRFVVRVLNAPAVLTVMDKNRELAFYNGQIDSVQNIVDQMRNKGGTYCNVVATHEFDKESFRNGLKFPVHSFNENVAGPDSRSILIRMPEHNLAIGCIKLSEEPFKLKEVRQSLKSFFAIELTH